jgi:hypothetical protein
MRKEIEIEFGTTFLVRNHPGREDVVINVGPQEKQFFHSARLFQADDGNIVLRPGAAGTAGPENIEKITGCLNLEEILEANKRGFEEQGMPGHFLKRSEEILKNSSLLPAKKIYVDE